MRVRKYSLIISDETYRDIIKLDDSNKLTISEIIRKALRLYKYIKHMHGKGYKIYFEKGDRKVYIQFPEL